MTTPTWVDVKDWATKEIAKARDELERVGEDPVPLRARITALRDLIALASPKPMPEVPQGAPYV